MKVTLHTDYALRLLTFLMLSERETVSTREVAEAYEVSLSHLNKVSRRLVVLGVLEASRGRGGGVRLAERARTFPLGDLVHSLEPAGELAACSGGEGQPSCRLGPACKLRGIFAEAKNAFYTQLNKFTLYDLVANHTQQLIELMPPPRDPARPNGRLGS